MEEVAKEENSNRNAEAPLVVSHGCGCNVLANISAMPGQQRDPNSLLT